MGAEAGWLWFWRVKAKAKTKASPATIHQALVAGEKHSDLDDLAIDDVLKALKRQFASFEVNRKKRLGEVDLEDEEAAFELSWSEKHLAFKFYGEAWKLMDRVVDVMTKAGVPCYNAGEPRMYALNKPPKFTETDDEEEIKTEWDKVMMEESAKIEASTPNRIEQMKQKQAFMKSGGMERAREEAVRRLQARKGK